MRIRQHPSGYVVAEVFLFLGVVILAIILARGSVRGFGDLIIATIVIGVTAPVAINEILSTAVPSIAIDGDTVQVRDRGDVTEPSRGPRSAMSPGGPFSPRCSRA